MIRHLQLLHEICNLPTAPYLEHHVIAWLAAWARDKPEIRLKRDKAGNVYLDYRRAPTRHATSRQKPGPVVLEAHMDHPGFIAGPSLRGKPGEIDAAFRGGVRPSHFAGAAVRFWVPDGDPPRGHWVRGTVKHLRVTKGTDGRRDALIARIAGLRSPVPIGSPGMWDLPDAQLGKGRNKQLFAARVCDDLAGVAAIVCVLESLLAQKVSGHVIGLLTRAEEVGFAGVLAICEHRWLPQNARIIGLETSKASGSGAGGGAVQGAGAVIRVGDRTGLFSPGLTHFLAQAAGYIGDEDPSFRFQRKLMDGGTCSSTAFTAWGYDAAALCLALGNYHNMTVKGEVGWRAGIGGAAGPGIASETIHLDDFAGMVRILVEAITRIGTYKPGFAAVRERLSTLHHQTHTSLLYK
jgi:endoglucanase